MEKAKYEITKTKMILATVGAFVFGMPVYVLLYPILHPENPQFHLSATVNPATALLGFVGASLVEDKNIKLKVAVFFAGLLLTFGYGWAFDFPFFGRIALMYAVIFMSKLKLFRF